MGRHRAIDMQYVDTAAYPIHQLGSPTTKDLIESSRKTLARDGVCVLEGFLTPHGVQQVLEASQPLLNKKCSVGGTITPYFGRGVGEHPEGHSTGFHMERDYAFVPADLIEDEHPLAQIYTIPYLREFLEHVLEKPMYMFEDPFQTINIKIEGDGGRQPFHFDSADGTITIMLQNATAGGEIEAVPNALGNEELISKALRGNFADIHKILYRYKPGTLILFNGTKCLHRVTECSGPTERVIGIYQFGDKPHLKADDKKSAMLYGPRVADKISRGDARPRHWKVPSKDRSDQGLSQAVASKKLSSKL